MQSILNFGLSWLYRLRLASLQTSLPDRRTVTVVAAGAIAALLFQAPVATLWTFAALHDHVELMQRLALSCAGIALAQVALQTLLPSAAKLSLMFWSALAFWPLSFMADTSDSAAPLAGSVIGWSVVFAGLIPAAIMALVRKPDPSPDEWSTRFALTRDSHPWILRGWPVFALTNVVWWPDSLAVYGMVMLPVVLFAAVVLSERELVKLAYRNRNVGGLDAYYDSQWSGYDWNRTLRLHHAKLGTESVVLAVLTGITYTLAYATYGDTHLSLVLCHAALLLTPLLVGTLATLSLYRPVAIDAQAMQQTNAVRPVKPLPYRPNR